MSAEASYALPVAGLLAIGDPNNNGVEGQIAALGLDQEHVPELVRMAVDPELNSAPGESLEVWAPLHAIRALKGLDASAHAADLMPLVELDEDDWFREELPEVFGQIGRSALAPLQAYLADRSHAEWGHVLVARALGEIGQRHPKLRDEVVASLSEVVRNAEQYDEMACTFAMDALVDLEAADAVPALRRAFELDKIDTMVRGDWGDILDQLGVDPEPDDPLSVKSRPLAAMYCQLAQLGQQVNPFVVAARRALFQQRGHTRPGLGLALRQGLQLRQPGPLGRLTLALSAQLMLPL